MKNDPPLHPLVTVAVPAWNAARFIGECVESVLAQTFADFELLIVDDGSDDDTCGVVERYSDSRIRLLRNSHDFIKTRNTLLSQARGKYMAFVDADDRMLPDRLEVQTAFMEAHPGVDVLGGGILAFGGDSPGVAIPSLLRGVPLRWMR